MSKNGNVKRGNTFIGLRPVVMKTEKDKLYESNGKKELNEINVNQILADMKESGKFQTDLDTILKSSDEEICVNESFTIESSDNHSGLIGDYVHDDR